MKAGATVANEESTAAEDVLRHIVDTTPALIHTGRPEGHLDYFNRGWLDLLGCSLDEVCGWRWTNFIHRDDVAGIVQKWHAALDSGEPFEAEARVRRANGDYRLFLHRKVPMRDERGTIIKWLGSSIDIEDSKQIEDALRAREQSFRRIVDSIPGLVHTTTSDGELEFFNRQILEYFGKTSDELKDWATNDVIHPDRPRSHIAAVSRTYDLRALPETSCRAVALDLRHRRRDLSLL